MFSVFSHQNHVLSIIKGCSAHSIPTKTKCMFGARCIANHMPCRRMISMNITPPRIELITGMGGAILNESILRKLPLMSLLAVTVEGIPDPAAVLSAVENLNTLFGMKIETEPLKETTSKYHEEMKRIMDDYAKMQSGEKKSDTMYA